MGATKGCFSTPAVVVGEVALKESQQCLKLALQSVKKKKSHTGKMHRDESKRETETEIERHA